MIAELRETFQEEYIRLIAHISLTFLSISSILICAYLDWMIAMYIIASIFVTYHIIDAKKWKMEDRLLTTKYGTYIEYPLIILFPILYGLIRY
ncbi:hypothetical protein J2Z48_000510 [Croceifilum oryzae]|uniref:Uncharacterized protein n=1 Tax=Croceifilum oryzae TaxID=1553429 RepID=A0AAJ1THK7_9BACL|nr:hypothetical protein [Croceifilum oryzae]MDQ0416346.1 hypothetical protein [Croceifilum oryzae]